jgi:cell division protein ZipA
MDNLRLILIISGLCIIAAIYLWDRIQSRRQSRRQTIDPSAKTRSGPERVISAQTDADDDLSSELADLNDFLSGSGSGRGINAGGIMVTREASQEASHIHGPIDADVDQERIIALYIVAPDGKYLAGSSIQAALSELGFRFGEMDIFHHYGTGQLTGDRPLFSLVNIHEPGYFDIANMNGFSTAGLSIFTRLPVIHDAEMTFTFMLEITRRLANKLGAGIQGPDRGPLDQDAINAIIRHIQHYDR